MRKGLLHDGTVQCTVSTTLSDRVRDGVSLLDGTRPGSRFFQVTTDVSNVPILLIVRRCLGQWARDCVLLASFGAGAGVVPPGATLHCLAGSC